MSNMTMAQQIMPKPLESLIYLDTKYMKIICLDSQCKHAIPLNQLANHLCGHRFREIDVVEAFLDRLGWIETEWVPSDGLAPRPHLPVIGGFKCTLCNYKSEKWPGSDEHGRDELHMTMDKPVYQFTRLQSWSGGKHWTVNESRTREESQPGIWELIRLNEKYKKIMCVASECGQVLNLKKLPRHLRTKHRMDSESARLAQDLVKSLGWLDLDAELPENGLPPQPYIPVVDGFRCLGCTSFLSRSAKDVDRHWRQAGHDSGITRKMEHVLLQSWDPAREEYWVVGVCHLGSGLKQIDLNAQDFKTDKIMRADEPATVPTGGIYGEEEWVVLEKSPEMFSVA